MRLLSLFTSIFLISCFNLTVCAQKTAVSESDFSKYQQALNLYNNQQYLAAQLLFVQLNNDTKNSALNDDYAFYSTTCAIYLDQNNAEEQLQNFINEYPTSTKLNDAYFVASSYFFEKGDFEKSTKYLDKIETNQITDNDLEVVNFQKGYAFFKNKNNKEAMKYLNLASKSKKYGDQAKYYLGFIAYQDNNFSEAKSQFSQLSADDQNKEKLSYFQADMSFKSGKFEDAINQGNLALKNSNPNEQSELNKIIGESYFNLNQFDKALPHLKQYKGQNGKWNNTDFYQLGYTYYKQNDFENPILQFNKIIDGSNLVAQNGYYHLGECYLKTNRKPQAFNAFKSASEMNFDLKIQEDANLNYAKLSYELGNSYQSVPDVLINFIEKYPKNPNNFELEKLLVNSFVSSKNYKQALILLEKHQTNDNKIAYQKVTFYRALELYNEGNFQQAIDMLKKSLAEPQDAKVLARSIFWNSEIQYELDNFKEALIGFKEFLLLSEAKNTPEFKNINYNIGYCYFKQKEYEQAIPFFQAFIDKTKDDSSRICDSYLRLGDCRFVSSKYWPALEAYNKVIEIKCTDADYATFQKALCYGFVNRNDKKINELTSFLTTFPKSKYRDDVLFELANVYVTERKNDLALKTYDQLISELPTGSYTSKSILKQGLIYYNSDKDDLAIVKFKKIAADFPNSPEAIEAVATARLIYVDNGKVNEFAAWVKTLSFVEFSDNELEKDSYNAAEKQYLQQNSKAAIDGFSNYITKFPNGSNIIKSNFYLGQLYFSSDLEQNAIPNYEFVITQSRNEFTEQSLVRLSQIYLKSNNSSKAIITLKRLENEADFPQNVTFGQINLMKIYYDLKDYTKAVIYAEKVLNNPKVDINVKSDAQIIVARSAFESKDETKAKIAYAKVALIAKGELAAEALYFDAYFKNKENKFEASNKSVQKLSKDFAGFKYYGAKGLILMAKNFYGLKDSFQATYILKAVIENFIEFPDVVSEAQNELETIKSEVSKTNSSILK